MVKEVNEVKIKEISKNSLKVPVLGDIKIVNFEKLYYIYI